MQVYGLIPVSKNTTESTFHHFDLRNRGFANV